MKTSAENLVEEIAEDFNTYLKKGVNYDPYTAEIDPNLNVEDIEKLLRIHFRPYGKHERRTRRN